MIYYQAICKKHNWASSLFTTRSGARRSGLAHVRNVSGRHDMELSQVKIPKRQMIIEHTERLVKKR